MFPFATAAMGGGVPSATLVGALWGAHDNTTPISFPVGTKAGDLAVMMCWAGFAPAAGSISGGAGGWTADDLVWISHGYESTLLWKVLAAGDLAGVTLNATSGGAYVLGVYRGATSVAVKERNLGLGGSEVPFTGFAKAGASRGIVTIVHDRGYSVPTAPAKLTRRTGGTYLHFTAWLADLLNVGLYPNGEDVTWTDLETSVDQVGWLLELT